MRLGAGRVASWADIAAKVFELRNGNADAVKPVSTAEYYASAKGPVSPRPAHSVLDLSKVGNAGFCLCDWDRALENYLDVFERAITCDTFK